MSNPVGLGTVQPDSRSLRAVAQRAIRAQIDDLDGVVDTELALLGDDQLRAVATAAGSLADAAIEALSRRL